MKIKNKKIKINYLGRNKKGMELSLSTIVIFIILLITFIVIMFFFVSHYGEGFGKLTGVGTDAIQNSKNFE